MWLNSVNINEKIQGLNWYHILTPIGLGCLCLLFRRFGKSSLRCKKVVIANTYDECLNVALSLSRKCAKYRVLGFDCEWVTYRGGRRPVALLQLASVDGFCALIRLCKLRNSRNTFLQIPQELKELLKDPSILKVGVVPSDDANYLFKDYGIVVRGCHDLRYLVQRNGGAPRGGLSGLAESILGVEMDKSLSVRCSNWESGILSERQISYAANDAWLAVKIFEVLALGKLKYSNCNMLDWLKSYWLYLKQGSFIPSHAWHYVDIKFHNRMNCSNDVVQYLPESAVPSINIDKQKLYKSSKLFPRAFSTRQTPLYHNCFMQAPDGAVLCTCDRKKAMWYVSKNLAELISEEPLTVRLKFEPSGRTDVQYYAQPKSNCCVVCGKRENCIRKMVVPQEYRKHFPNVMKSHVSHDVLLLCPSCHLRSNNYDSTLKRQLTELCGAPFDQGGNAKHTK